MCVTRPNTQKAKGFTEEGSCAGRVGDLSRATHLVAVEVDSSAGSLAPGPVLELPRFSQLLWV